MIEFLKELTRRKVWLFGGIYLALGWVLLQVAVVIETTLSLPGWVDQIALVLLGLGFPVALLLAWAQESQSQSQSQGRADETSGNAQSDPEAAPANRRNLSIAVLPFDDLSRDGEFVEVADGVPEDILTRLTMFGGLDVTARNSSFAFKGTSPDIRQVGEALGVRFVLEGSFRNTGEQVRLTAQLIETGTGRHIWSDNFDLGLETWAREIDGAVDGLVGAVANTVLAVEGKRLLAGPLEALTVLELNSFALMRIADGSLINLNEAKVWVELALKKAPGDATANATMARIKALLPMVGGGDRQELWASALEHLTSAKQAGPPDMGVLVSLAGAAFGMGRMKDVEAFAESMRALAPKHPAAWGFTMASLVAAGRWQESLEAGARGKVLSSVRSPFHISFIMAEAVAQAGLGDFEAAEKAARKHLIALEHDTARAVLVTALVRQDRLSEAAAELDVLKQARPGLTLSAARKRLEAGGTNSEMIELLLDGLARAGLETEGASDA